MSDLLCSGEISLRTLGGVRTLVISGENWEHFK